MGRVELEEGVLEPGGLDEEVRHRERGDDRQQGLRVALEVAREARAVDGDRRHAGDAREVGRIALELQLDPPLAAGEERGHVLVRDQPARPDQQHQLNEGAPATPL